MRFPNFVKNWDSKKFQDIFCFLTNNTLSRDNLNYDKGNSKNIHYGDILTKYTTLKDIGDEDVPFVNKDTSVNTDLLYSNDVIIADTAEDFLVGKAIEIVNDYNKPVYSGLHTIPLRPTIKFASGFVALNINSYNFRKKVHPLIQGIKVYSLSKSSLSKCNLHFPEYDEQLKISNFILRLEDRISTQKKIISNIESQIKSIKYVLLNSNNGCKKALKDILDEVSLKSTINNQYPVVSSTVKGLVLQSEYFDKEIASSDNIGYKIITRNNIIISPQNLWMGNITFNDKFERGIVSPSYKIFNVKEDYNKLYIFELMTTTKAFYLYKTVSEQGASVVRKNLNFEAFMQLSFNIPSLEVQNKTINTLYCFKNKYKNEKKVLSLYEQQKQYLLNHMFI